MPMTAELPIKRCRPSEDTVPFSECRNNFSAIIAKVSKTHRPVLVTQNGRAASYIINAGDFDDLMDRIELSRSVSISRQQFENGEFIPHDEVMRNMQDMLDDLKARGEIA